MSRSARKRVPDRVKLIAALARFGLKIEQVQFDHSPPLALRPINPETGDTIPPANDPVFIQMLTIDEHRVKTTGKPATTAGSDIHAIARVKRLSSQQEAFRQRLLAKEPCEPQRKVSKIPTRPFPKRDRRSAKAQA